MSFDMPKKDLESPLKYVENGAYLQYDIHKHERYTWEINIDDPLVLTENILIRTFFTS